MLKTKLTKEGFDALTESEQQHYTADAKGLYILATEEARDLKQALDSERRRAEKSEKLLKVLLPDLPEDKAEWELFATEAAEPLKELRTIDLEEWKTLKADADPTKKKDKGELEAERLDLQKQVRDLTRDKGTWDREREKLVKKADSLATENLTLSRTTALNEALDAVKITDPEDRETVTALFTMRGLEPQDVGGKRIFFVKTAEGAEVPLGEYAKDFVGTPSGKKYVSAPDSAGVGDGEPRPVKPVAQTAFEAMNADQKVAAALSPGGVGAGKQAEAPR